MLFVFIIIYNITGMSRQKESNAFGLFSMVACVPVTGMVFTYYASEAL